MSSNNKIQKSLNKNSKRFSDEERAAMKARAKELKNEERANKNRSEGEESALSAIAAMHEPARSIAKRLNTIIKDCSSNIYAKTWYGMPAYAGKDDKIVCYFRPAEKFKERYSMFGFNDSAKLDDGDMWPIAYAIKELTHADETRIIALVKKALG